MTPIDLSRILSTEAGPVLFSQTTLSLWGDAKSGHVNDWIYASSERIFQLVFSLPPGGSFGHSERKRTVFAGDELYHVLSGTLLLANPETGEVLRLETGESAYFRPDTWHHGFSQGTQELCVLEFFAPPPAAGASQVYAQTKPYLSDVTYGRNHLVGKWPEAAEKASAEATLRRIAPDDVMWRIEGNDRKIPVGILLSTDQLTVGRVDMLPGQASELRVHDGDMSLYVKEGRLNVLLPDDQPAAHWFQLGPRDGFFVPAGTPYEFWNMSDGTTGFMFAVAPRYLRDA